MKRFLLCAIILVMGGMITGCSFDLRSQIEDRADLVVFVEFVK